jgi:Transposase IS4
MLRRYLHGCNVLYELIRPWANTNIIVVADSYFASVQAALRLYRVGMRFIGTVKTATKEFPMNYLGSCVLGDGRGDRHGLISKDAGTGCSLLALVWVDRDRRYFISTCSSLSPGHPCTRWRWRQVDAGNAPPIYRQIMIQQPQVTEAYYNACGKIDQHNRHRSDNLQLERKIKTMEWWRRVSMTLFGMCITDSYLLMVGCRGENCGFRTARDFFDKLSEQLIDNTFEFRDLRRRNKRAFNSANPLAIANDEVLDANLHMIGITPTRKRKKSQPSKRAQGRCMVCEASTTYTCRECQRFQPDPKGHQYFICNKEGKKCMGIHILQEHPHAVRGSSLAEEDDD